MYVAHCPLGHQPANRREIRIEPPLEPDHERHASARHFGVDCVDVLELEIDGLLGENRFTGRRGGHDDFEVRGSGGSDDDRVDTGVRQDVAVVPKNTRAAELRGQRPCRHLIDIGDGDQFRADHPMDEIRRMNASYPPGAKYTAS